MQNTIFHKFNTKHHSSSTDKTKNIASNFVADYLKRDTAALILLTAPVGAGKSVFVKAALQALHFDVSHFSSPSFTLVNEYEKDDSIAYHIDLYRLNITRKPARDSINNSSHVENGESEQARQMIEKLELSEKIDEGIVFIEWAQRISKQHFSLPYYDICIDIVSETERNIKIERCE